MIIGEVYSNNKPVLVVLELNPLGHDDIQLDEFKIASAYSKDNAQYLINSSELLYIDKNKKRVRNREKRTGLLLPVGSSVPNSDSNISQNKTAVNTEYEQKSKDDTTKYGYASKKAQNGKDDTEKFSLAKFINSESGDISYHTVVTVFEPDLERDGLPFDYAEELLSNPNNYELEIVRKQPIESVYGKKHPNTLNELLSNDSISQDDTPVNTEYAQNGKDDTPKISLAKPVERIKDLIAVHNLTQEELMKSLEQSRLENLNALDEYKFSLKKKNLESKDKKKYNKSKKKYTRYSEYDTLLMQWIYSASALIGDMKAFTDSKGNVHFFEKTEDGCIEIARAEFNERKNSEYVEDIERAKANLDFIPSEIEYGRGRNSQDTSIYRYA